MNGAQSIMRVRVTKPYPCLRCGGDPNVVGSIRAGMCARCTNEAMQNVPVSDPVNVWPEGMGCKGCGRTKAETDMAYPIICWDCLFKATDKAAPSVTVDALNGFIKVKDWDVTAVWWMAHGGCFGALALTWAASYIGWQVLGGLLLGASLILAYVSGAINRDWELIKRFGLGRK